MIEKYDLEKQWHTGARVISSRKEPFDLYRAQMHNSHTDEKMIYESPLYQR